MVKLVGKDWVTPFKNLIIFLKHIQTLSWRLLVKNSGFIGIFVVVILLGLLIFRAMKIGRESPHVRTAFPWFFALGISFWIFFQGFVNLGMALGMLPTKGLTFPLVSYGGSSIIIMSATVGILLRIDHENRLQRGGQARLRDD